MDYNQWQKETGLSAVDSEEPLESSEWRSGPIQYGTLPEHESQHRARRSWLSGDQVT